MAAVAELVAGLEAMRAMKPPGVSGKRLAPLTTLCTENIKAETDLIKAIYVEFKKTPSTHKLGVLYVVDAVTRSWIQKGAGQKPSAGEEGTFPAAVKRITDLLPTLMDETIKEMPEDQKVKIEKLVDIWDRGKVFNSDIIKDFNRKLNPSSPRTEAAPHNGVHSSGTGSHPAPALPQSIGPSAADILAGLTQPKAQHTPQPPQQTAPAPFPFPQSMPAPYALPPPVSQTPQQYPPQQYSGQNGNSVALPVPPLPTPVVSQAAAPDAMAALNAVKAMLPPGAASDPEQFNKWIGVLQQLQQMGVDQKLWGDVIKTMVEGSSGAALQPSTEAPRDSPRQGRGRGRSRSPGRRARGSPVYDTYDKSQSNKYRQRSPLRRDSNSPSKQADQTHLGKPEKRVDFDHSLPPGHIKVYSRTLFVGGATSGEAELRRVFSRFGVVQTVISHRERRHAFIKMMTRRESEVARQGADNSHDPEVSKAVRTVRWGVGFGPRDCSDYTTGISIIPIARLTEADRKWVNTAEVGGIGDMKLEPGMVFEEPDIEIGAGVSSKAISQRPNLNNQFNSKGKNRDKGHRNGSGSNQGHEHSQHEAEQEKQARRVPAYEQYGLPPVTPQANMPLPAPHLAQPAYPQPYQPPFMPPAPTPYDTSAYGVPPVVPGYGMGFSWGGAPGQ